MKDRKCPRQGFLTTPELCAQRRARDFDRCKICKHRKEYDEEDAKISAEVKPQEENKEKE
ncbi:MAG: hypothetical protein AABY32_01490 [Nanoarchaeota archaeon]